MPSIARKDGAFPSRAAFHAAVLSGYAALAVGLTYPVAFRISTHIPIAHQIPGWRPGDGDPWQSLWGLWLAHRSIAETGRLPLSTDLVFYPLGIDLWYVLVVAAPLLAAVPLVSLFGLVSAYNLLFLASFALSGYTAFLLARRLTGHEGAAFCAGLIFAFSPYQMAHAIEHLFLLAAGVWVPLAVLFLVRTFEDGGAVNLGLAAVLSALTLMSNPYHVIFVGIFGLFYALHRLWRGDGPRRETIARALALAGLSAVLMLPVAWPALGADPTETTLALPLATVNDWSADLLAFFVPSAMHPIWGRLVEPLYRAFTGNLFEQTVYAGYSVLALAVVALVRAPRRARFWALAALAFFVLSLGPLLHVGGRHAFEVDGATVTVPLPGLVLHFIPVLRDLQVFSRFDFMLMLCLAMLAGLALASVLPRGGGGPARRGATLLPGLVSVVVVLEFAAVPLPVLEARIPPVYAAMGGERGARGSLLDVPLDWRIARHLYYQTAHRRPLITGFVPRPSPSLVEQAEGVPFMRLFREPDRVAGLAARAEDRASALRVVDLFDLGAIVIHREYLGSATVERLAAYLRDTFPVDRADEEGGPVVLRLRRDHDSVALWEQPGGYRFDFGSPAPRFFVSRGWSLNEDAYGTTMAWSDARESVLGFYLPRVLPLTMEVRVLPFTFPSAPRQGVAVHVNGRPLGEIALEEGWRTYALAVPASALRRGANVARFTYRYTAAPAAVLPGSADPRRLAVAFDEIVLRPGRVDAGETGRHPGGLPAGR